jgi:hypothetical protein
LLQGGSIVYDFSNIPAVSAATADFSTHVVDARASIITNYNFISGQTVS